MENDIRDLWKQQEQQHVRISPDELRKKSTRLQRRVRIGLVAGLLASAFVLVSFTNLALQMPDWPRRIGAGLTAIVGAYFIQQLIQNRMRKTPADLSNSASVDFYRQELERQRDFHQGWRFWSRLAAFYPGYLLFCWGYAVEEPASAHSFAWIAVTVLILGPVAIVLNLRKARIYQQRIDEIT